MSGRRHFVGFLSHAEFHFNYVSGPRGAKYSFVRASVRSGTRQFHLHFNAGELKESLVCNTLTYFCYFSLKAVPPELRTAARKRP